MFRFATASTVPSSRTPQGTIAKAANALATASMGAAPNSTRSASRGTRSSLKRSFTPSAKLWSSPCHPTRIGPSRSWTCAATLRSSQIE